MAIKRAGFKLAVAGPRAWKRTHLEENYRGYALTNGASEGLFTSAMVVIGDNYRNDIAGYWSDRLWLAMAAGCAYVTPRVPLHPEGEAILFYDDDESLVDQVRYAVANFPRLSMAALAKADDNRYHHRLEEMFSALSGKRAVACPSSVKLRS